MATQLITHVTQILRIANFYTRGSRRIPPHRRMRRGGPECRRKSHKCRVYPGDKTRRERRRVFRQLCGFLPVSSWLSVPFCVRRRRHVGTSCGQFRVRTDLVQCDIFTVQYRLFNCGASKFISGVNPYNLVVNMYPNGVNQV